VRSGIGESNGRYFLIGSDYTGPWKTFDPDGRACAIWSQGEPWTPAAWRLLDCALAQSGESPLYAPIGDLFSGDALVLGGPMNDVAESLLRIFRVLDAVAIADHDKLELFSHCLIRLERGEPVDVEVERLPAIYWPGVSSQMADDSYRLPTYVPAHLVWSLYFSVFGRKLTTSEWLRRRFSDESIRYVEPVLGFELEVRPQVFIPDPIVVDILVAAALSPGSPLLGDLAGGTVLEPCTGSGILALSAAALGAPMVVSTDIDPQSVECARQNAHKTRLADRIRVDRGDGLPKRARGTMLLINPPWFRGLRKARQADVPDHYRRCLEDPKGKLLTHLLEQAARRDVEVSYVFFGAEDPFEAHGFLPVPPLAGWTAERRWQGRHGIRLYRLVRAAG